MPQGWKIVQAKALDLDGDRISDRVLVLEQLDTEGAKESRQLEGPRSLVLLKGTPNGFRMMTRASDNVLLCRECGGVCGDPLQPVVAERGSLSIIHYGGSNWIWAFTHTFELRGGHWVLTSLNEFASNPFTGEAAWNIPPSECQSIRLDAFLCGEERWQEVKIGSKQAFFHDSPDPNTRSQRYVIAGQQVTISRVFNTLAEASYTDEDGKKTSGFLLLSDVDW